MRSAQFLSNVLYFKGLGAGQSFSEMALIEQKDVGLRTASVRAKGGFVELLKLTKDDYDKVKFTAL